MLKKIFILIITVSTSTISAQCAMCKAVVEGGNNSMAEGINDGITYLMIFPYILIGLLLFMLYKHRKKLKE